MGSLSGGVCSVARDAMSLADTCINKIFFVLTLPLSIGGATDTFVTPTQRNTRNDETQETPYNSKRTLTKGLYY